MKQTKRGRGGGREETLIESMYRYVGSGMQDKLLNIKIHSAFFVLMRVTQICVFVHVHLCVQEWLSFYECAYKCVIVCTSLH